MTDNIEKQFFDTFGIKPNKKQESELVAIGENIRGLKRVEKPFYDYPQITDRILLELICIDYVENPYKCRGHVSNVEELKNYLLGQFIHEFENDLFRDKDDIKQQVQALFEEG